MYYKMHIFIFIVSLSSYIIIIYTYALFNIQYMMLLPEGVNILLYVVAAQNNLSWARLLYFFQWATLQTD